MISDITHSVTIPKSDNIRCQGDRPQYFHVQSHLAVPVQLCTPPHFQRVSTKTLKATSPMCLTSIPADVKDRMQENENTLLCRASGLN